MKLYKSPKTSRGNIGISSVSQAAVMDEARCYDCSGCYDCSRCSDCYDCYVGETR